MARYDSKYVTKLQEDLADYSENKQKYTEFIFDIPEGFANIPVIEICRLMDNLDDIYFRDKITKQALLNRKVIVRLDEKEIDNFQVNNITDRWDVFPVFEKYPLALKTLMEITVSYLTKKLLPPLKDIPKKI